MLRGHDQIALVFTFGVIHYDHHLPLFEISVTGYVDVDGFFSNGILRLSGYNLTSDKPGTERDQLQILGERAVAILIGSLKEKRPGITARVAMPAEGSK